MQSRYGIKIPQNIDSFRDNDMLVVDYDLPNKSDLSDVKEYKYIASSKEIRTKTYTESYIAKRYENVLYSIALRSLYEIFYVDKDNEIKAVTFNGFVTQINPATGIRERKCILSLQVDREKFSQIVLLLRWICIGFMAVLFRKLLPASTLKQSMGWLTVPLRMQVLPGRILMQ